MSKGKHSNNKKNRGNLQIERSPQGLHRGQNNTTCAKLLIAPDKKGYFGQISPISDHWAGSIIGDIYLQSACPNTDH